LQSLLNLTVDREGIESFAIDPQQGRLFTLHTRGEIEYYDVSTSNFVSRGKYTRLKSDLVSRGYAGQAPGYVGARVVSIAAVEGHESRRACMVAITANGESERRIRQS
jgi:nuclear pore complex protein Nup155